RALPAVGGGLFFVLVVALILGSGTSEQAGGAQRFVNAWKRGDYAAMHAQLTPKAQRLFPLPAFEAAYRSAAATATAFAVDPGEARDSDVGAVVPVTLRTRA